jgi:lipoprotein-anchoring transpeptidase ErfK/SrfK
MGMVGRMHRIVIGLMALVLAGGIMPASAQDTIVFGSMGGDDTGPVTVKRKAGRKLQASAFVLEAMPNGAHMERQIVAFERDVPAGSIVVQTAKRRLYFVLPDKKAILYPVGVGREGFQWSGRNHISRKAEWPTWTPPPEMIKREAKKGRTLPARMEGGTDNPLGARALYLGNTSYRIHGTTSPWSIGTASSSGCIRMLNEHVIDLYDRAKIGALVIVE